MLVDVPVGERDERQRHVRRAERAVDEPAGRQAARAARQGVGERDVLAPDEAVAGPPVRELARAGLAGHRGDAGRLDDGGRRHRGGESRACRRSAVARPAQEVGAAHVRAARDEQLLGREAGDHVAARSP